MAISKNRIWAGRVAPVVVAALLAAGAAAADDSCREWSDEHRRWTVQALRGYLTGAAQREMDEALFEVLQREAYLTSCDLAVSTARDELVGWRLVGRVPDEYGSAVAESVLDRAGFDLTLQSLFQRPAPTAERRDAEPRGRRQRYVAR
jgi:hypothetical protein